MADDKLGSLVSRMGGTTPVDHGNGQDRTPPPKRERTEPPARDKAPKEEPAEEPKPRAKRPARKQQDKATPTPPERTGKGDLVQARVQPSDVARWFNAVADGGAFAFNATRGEIAGAILLVAQHHSDEIAAVLEEWGGTPADHIRAMVWDQLKATELAPRDGD